MGDVVRLVIPIRQRLDPTDENPHDLMLGQEYKRFNKKGKYKRFGYPGKRKRR